MAVWQAKRRGLKNFAVLVSHVLVPPAITAILSSPANRVQGFLAAGHVCTVMGYEEYIPLAERFRIPIVVTGFEPLDLLEGVYRCVCDARSGSARGREPICPAGTPRGQRGRDAVDRRSVRGRAIASGAASARFRTADFASRENIASSTPSAASPSSRSKCPNRRRASAVRSCKG